MESVKELKDVLERVEGKLIAAGKMYSAMNFSIWLSVMLGFYVLMGLTNLPPLGVALYWITAGAIGFIFTGKVLKRFITLLKSSGAQFRGLSYSVALPWFVGSILGWVIIPRMHLGASELSSLAIGFLSFISLSVFGMWSLFRLSGADEREMIPSFLIPALGIPAVARMSTSPMIFAGFLVSLGFSLTVLWCLHSAFRRIG